MQGSRKAGDNNFWENLSLNTEMKVPALFIQKKNTKESEEETRIL
jgi:hypothetical protein